MPATISNSPIDDRTSVGIRGELLAAELLEANGYRLVISNFKVPVGRNSRGVRVTGEIDIVAVDAEGVLCFVEVKTRTSDAFAGPLSAVDVRKQRQITRTSKIYRRVFGLWRMPTRFDVVTVVMPPGGRPKVELVRGFWTAEKFRKRRWEPDLYGDKF